MAKHKNKEIKVKLEILANITFNKHEQTNHIFFAKFYFFFLEFISNFTQITILTKILTKTICL